MNHLLVAIAAVLYVVIGVITVARSVRYLRQLNPSVAGMPVVIAIIGVAQTLLWPIAMICEPLVLKQVAPHLLPVKPTKVKSLDRIASGVEALNSTLQDTFNRLLDESENLRERVAGLEQSRRDILEGRDAIRVDRDAVSGKLYTALTERDNATRSLRQAQFDLEQLSLALRNSQAEVIRLRQVPAPATEVAPPA